MESVAGGTAQSNPEKTDDLDGFYDDIFDDLLLKASDVTFPSSKTELLNSVKRIEL
jgi:hypothetical protein